MLKTTPIERIQAVVAYSEMSMNRFAIHIGLPRGENLYQIKRGHNGVSHDVADRICEKFPEIDELWLLTGKGQMLRNDVPNGIWSAVGTPNSEAFRGWAAVQALQGLLAAGTSIDVVSSAVHYADQIMAQLEKGR